VTALAVTLVLVMIVLLFLGYPMKIPLIAATMVAVAFWFPEVDPGVLVQQMIGGVKPAALIAVPMFIFAAEIMSRGQAADRLLAAVMSFVGHIRGGLPITTAMSCTLFGALSGSTQATVVAIGGPLRPKLLEAGYPDSFTTALIINASDIALLIPPSIGMIVYGVVSGTSIGELFIAGIGPGLVILFFFCIYCWIASIRLGVPRQERASWRKRGISLLRAWLPLGFPAIVIGGIYGGIFSPTEAAAVSVVWAGFIEIFVFRELKIRQLPEMALNTALVTAVVFVLVGAGAAFSWIVSFAQLPDALIHDFLGLGPGSGYATIMATIAVAFFVGCMFVDPIVVILILTPIFHPVAVAAGIDPVLVGVIVTLQVAIGSATPPFGCDIFTAIAIFRRPYMEVLRGTPPFIAILLASSILCIAVPQISLTLRDLAFADDEAAAAAGEEEEPEEPVVEEPVEEPAPEAEAEGPSAAAPNPDAETTWRFAIEETRGSVQDAYATRFAELVEERSDGRIDVVVYPYGTLGTSDALTELIHNGTIQFVMASPGHLGKLIPEVQVFLLHFVLSDDDAVNRRALADPELLATFDALYHEKNLELLSVYSEGWMVWTTNRDVTEPAHFEGVKMRVMTSPLLLAAYAEYGASPTPLPYSEVYSGLQLNMIDGQVNPVFAIQEMSFYEVSDVMTFARHAPFITTAITNQQFYEGLSEADRALVDGVVADLVPYIDRVQQRFNEERLAIIREKKPSLKVVDLTPAQRAAFRERSLAVREQYLDLGGDQAGVVLEQLLEAVERAEAAVGDGEAGGR